MNKNQNILVTGGAGFIGSNLSNTLYNLGHNVTVIDNESNGNPNRLLKGINFKSMNVLDYNDVLDYDYIFHLSCVVIRDSENNPENDLNVNALSTLKLLEKLKHSTKLKRFIYASTTSIYGYPETLPVNEDSRIDIRSLYSATKFLSENYCNLYSLNHGVPISIARFSNIYGYNQDASVKWVGVIGKFIDEIKNNRKIKIYGDGESKRDFTFITDAIDALLLVAFSNVSLNKTYNISSNLNYSINNIISILTDKLGEFEKEYTNPTLVDNIPERLVSYKKLHKDFGWFPKINLPEGITKLIEQK